MDEKTLTAQDCIDLLRQIKDVSFATSDDEEAPRIRIIDVMLTEPGAIIFCTARGKDFYRQLSAADAVVLEDDLGFFPSYLCGNVVRNQVLEEHPELRDVLAKLEGTITDEDMAQMNYQVETEGAEPADVAREFLQAHGLLDS